MTDTGGWKKIQNRKKKFQPEKKDGRQNLSEATTLFVSNLPSQYHSTSLWKACQSHGKIIDAYVANRKNKQGYNFGFVRFLEVRNIEELIWNLRKIKLNGVQLFVKQARFGKNKQSIVNMTEELPKETHQENKVAEVAGYQRTYKEVFMGSMERKEPKKQVILPPNIILYPDSCKRRALIGEAKNPEALCNLKMILNAGGHKNVSLNYVGGLKVLLKFNSNVEAISFLHENGDIWQNLFSKLEIWNGQEMEYDRIVGLQINGMPIHLRDDELFNKIGEAFGKIIWPSDFSWIPENISMGSCYVITKLRSRIDEEVTIKLRNEVHSIWVSELPNTWYPEFTEEETVPIESEDDVDSHIQSIESENDDMEEEGEIRPDPDTHAGVASARESGYMAAPAVEITRPNGYLGTPIEPTPLENSATTSSHEPNLGNEDFERIEVEKEKSDMVGPDKMMNNSNPPHISQNHGVQHGVHDMNQNIGPLNEEYPEPTCSDEEVRSLPDLNSAAYVEPDFNVLRVPRKYRSRKVASVFSSLPSSSRISAMLENCKNTKSQKKKGSFKRKQKRNQVTSGNSYVSIPLSSNSRNCEEAVGENIEIGEALGYQLEGYHDTIRSMVMGEGVKTVPQ